MKSHILYTTSFFFPYSPTVWQYLSPISSLKQGADGVFGIGMSTTFESEDPDHHAIACFFLEIDLNTGGVTEQSTTFPYMNLDRVQVGYDAVNKTWIAALEAGEQEAPHERYRVVLDLCEVAHAVHGSWPRLLRLEDLNNEYQRLVTFWQHEQTFPFLFVAYLGDDGLSASRLYWRSWRMSDAAVPGDTHLLGKSFFDAPYVFDETFLLFTGEYQRRSCQWRLRIAAYTTDGTRIHHKSVPHVSFPNRHEGYYVADDLYDWLWPTIYLTQGPGTGMQRRQTCVAALLLKEQLERSPAWKKGRLPRIDHGLPSVQGGLYWVDQEGHILCHESSLLGEQISMCLCGEVIVGTDFLDSQRRLWSWSPVEATQRKIHAMLAPDAERVTLVAMDGNQQEGTSSFWCVEEYDHGMRVSLWDISTFEATQCCWVTGLRLADHLAGPGSYREPCVAASQGTLLIVGITQEGRFQIIQFQ